MPNVKRKSIVLDNAKPIADKFAAKLLDQFDFLYIEGGLGGVEVVESVKQGNSLAINYNLTRDEAAFEQLEKYLKTSCKANAEQLGEYAALKNIVVQSLLGFEKALTLPSPKDRFVDLFESILDFCEKRGLDENQTAGLLNEAKKSIGITLTSTVHPTVFLKFGAIEFQRKLTHQLEAIAHNARKTDSINAVNNSEYNDAVNNLIRNYLQRVKNNEAITHYEPVTVEEEVLVATSNTKLLINYQKDVVGYWNEAFDIVAEQRKLNKQKYESIKFAAGENPFDNRTWVRADADGREKTDVIETYKACMLTLESKQKLDFRQNSQVFANAASALMQVEFARTMGDEKQNIPATGFAVHCSAFVKSINRDNAKEWIDPKRSLYQHLGDFKAQFLRGLIDSDFHFVPPEIIAHAEPFVKAYLALFDQFVQDELELNEARAALSNPRERTQMPADVTYNHLKKYVDTFGTRNSHGDLPNLQQKFRDLVENMNINFKLNGKREYWSFAVGEDGIHYIQLTNKGLPTFFIGTYKKGSNGTPRIRLNPDERKLLMDNIRKLEIIRHFIDTYGQNVVGERFEIANFSAAENFWELFLLFKEAKIINLKDGLVKNTGLSIVPLLETGEDLKNGKAIFEELLKDDLFRSYCQVRGGFELMFGFSDGAKSIGNGPSRWAIRKASEELTILFASYGIKLSVKQGRGSTTERGGMIEAGANTAQLSDAVNTTSKHNSTIQADQPLRWATSPAEGHDQLASLIVGQTASYIAAKTRTNNEKRILATCEEAMDFIFKVWESHFQEVIRYNPDAVKFLNAMFYNQDSSSRAAKRNASASTDFETFRAVPVSNKGNKAKCPFNDIGLKKALEAFISGEEVEIKSYNGEVLTTKISSKNILAKLEEFMAPVDVSEKAGFNIIHTYSKLPSSTKAISNRQQRVLEVLKKHPHFESLMRITEMAMQTNFDPVIATKYGEKTNCQEFTNEAIASLTGLQELCQLTLRRVTGSKYLHHREQTLAEVQNKAGKTFADVMLVILDPKARMNKADESSEAKALRLFEAVTASDDMTPSPTAERLRDLPTLLLGAGSKPSQTEKAHYLQAS